MYFKYSDESEYEDHDNHPAKDKIKFIKHIEFNDGGELALVYNAGSTCDGWQWLNDDDDDEYFDDYKAVSDNVIYLNGDYQIENGYNILENGYNILIVSANDYNDVLGESDFGEEGLSNQMLERFQQLYKVMSIGTSVKN